MWWFCQIFGCPFRKENECAAVKREAEKDKELEWRRKVMIKEGINYGGSFMLKARNLLKNSLWWVIVTTIMVACLLSCIVSGAIWGAVNGVKLWSIEVTRLARLEKLTK